VEGAFSWKFGPCVTVVIDIVEEKEMVRAKRHKGYGQVICEVEEEDSKDVCSCDE